MGGWPAATYTINKPPWLPWANSTNAMPRLQAGVVQWLGL